MSKIDDLRALREARYAQQAARPATAARRPQPLKTTPAEPAAKVAKAAVPASDELCGHRNMSGRTCTREHGHSAKSHRYS
ncbi:hypothetical protein GCM10011584_30280 [Nocardioides phosphati]|uniref:Uncharacterized protein n=1 Tax=Nocardioides phosphati TaxID=1867775 RepID=A0ABQ2NCM8_9ACTN|nr:hypothetical protein [Nocardioides phosphati]GGO92871.1 hypothetical protein GCM10011584_30280 [Nocardioides phosphati]